MGARSVGHLEAFLGLNTLGLTKGLARANAALVSAGKRMQASGRALSLGLSLPLAVIGGLAIATAAKFEKSMNQVAAVVQGTAQQMMKLEKIARQLGKTTKFTATQAAEGMNFLAMAGFSVKEIMEALPTTLSLAAAGNMELARAADIVSNIMRGFGIEASRTAEVADVLTKTFTSSNTSLEQLGFAMSFAAPVSKAFGQSIETTSAAIGFLSDAGIQATRAGTGMRQIWNQLIKKQSELGISLTSMDGRFLDLADILEQIEKKGLATAEVFSIMGARAGTAMVTLLGRGSKALREFSFEVGNAGGITKEVADTQMRGFTGASLELKSAVQEMAIAFSESLLPVLESVTDRIKGIVNWFSSASTETKKLTILTIAFGVALGPVIFALGKVALLVGAINWPIALVVAGMVSLIAVFALFQHNAELALHNIRNLFDRMDNDIIGFAQSVLRVFDKVFNKIIEGINLIRTHLNLLPLEGGTAIEELISDLEGMKSIILDSGIEMITLSEIWVKGIAKMRKALLGLFPTGGFGGGEGPAIPSVTGEMQTGILSQRPDVTIGGGFGGAADILKAQMDAVRKYLSRVKQMLDINAQDWTGWMAQLRDIWLNLAAGAKIGFNDLIKVVGTAMKETGMLQQAMVSAFSGLGQALGEAITGGGDEFTSAFDKILLIVLDFAKTLGAMLISMGAAIILIPFLTGPAGAFIAAGIALTALATAGSVSINRKIAGRKERAAEAEKLQGLAHGGFVTEGGVFQLHRNEQIALPAGSAVTSARGVRRDKGGTLTTSIGLRELVIALRREEERMGR